MAIQILIMSEDPIAAVELAHRLEMLGYELSGQAVDQRQAGQLLSTLTPDMILVDIGAGDGFRNVVLPGDVPVIFLSAEVDALVMERVRLDGAQDILVKPVHDNQLRTSIEMAHSRWKLESSTRENEEHFSLAMLASREGVWDWNLKTGKFYYSPGWKSMLGYADDEIGSQPDEWFKRVEPEDQGQLQADFVAHVKGDTSNFECEYRIRHADGSTRWMLAQGIALRGSDGAAYRVAGVQIDITPRKLEEDRQAYDLLHDLLTGLPNRVLFMDRLGFRLERAKRYTHLPFAVLYVDLDRFKVVNDTLGHAAGDQLLITTAMRIQQCLRPDDTVARLAGDEFAILINEVHDIQDAVRISDRIRSRLVTTTMLGSVERSPTASIGIALCDNNYDSAEDLLRDADLAMYRAKTAGKNRHQVFNSDMLTGAVALLQLEVELKRAVARQEWVVHYQPIISLQTGETIGVEALVRWQHPERGLVYPAGFIRVAEDAGYILRIGEFVLQTVCRQMVEWREAGHPGLWASVNISARQFQDEHLVEMVERILHETGLPSDGLRLEVTESVAMHDLDYTVRILNQLDKLGVYTSLDDFGTGYSSLNYLKRFPLKVLKIDQSFIQDIRVNKNSEAITEAIIAMARSLNLEVVAEGVEKEDQVSFLRDKVCDHVQGYFFSRPMGSEAMSQVLAGAPNLKPG